MKKILVVALVIAVIIGIIWTWKPWEKPQKITETKGGGEGGEAGVNPTASFTYSIDNQNPLKVQFNSESTDPDGDISTHSWSFGDGSSSSSVNPTHTYDKRGTYTVELEVADSQGNSDTYSISITVQKVPQGYTLFKYTASFEYLSSNDNKPIDDEVFIIYPCPNIDNEPVVSEENFTWQLIAHYIENGEDIWHVQVDNGLPGEFILPRKTALGYLPPFIKNTSHGPKVWLQTYPGWYEPAQDYVENAMYQNEIYRIQTEFLVPENQAGEVTLIDNQGGIYFGANGYSGDNYKPICHSVEVSLSRWVNDTFEPLGTFSAIGDNPPECTWVELSPR